MTSPYERLGERLGADAPDRSPTVTAFPDGSVDRYCEVTVGAGQSVDRIERLGELLAEGVAGSIGAHPSTSRSGGQAVNLARQADALGADVHLYGHLDDPIFADLPVETTSMGEPSEVLVLEFEADALFVSVDPDDVRGWDGADLLAAMDDPTSALSADAVTCSNWISFPGMADAFERIAARDPDGGVFVFDPGDVGGGDPDDLETLLSATARLGDAYDAIVSVNESEARTLGTAAGCAVDAIEPSLAALREAADLDAAVLHGVERGVAVRAEDVRSVPTPTVEDPDYTSGAGDAFDAGLAYAAALGWEWDLRLALGNACASRYVEHGEPASPDALVEFLDGVEVPERNGEGG